MNFDMQKDIKEILEDAVVETGVELKTTPQELAKYILQRASHLASIAGEVGYSLAMRAERDNVALKAGIAITKIADAADARIIGIIQASLKIASSALSV